MAFGLEGCGIELDRCFIRRFLDVADFLSGSEACWLYSGDSGISVLTFCFGVAMTGREKGGGGGTGDLLIWSEEDAGGTWLENTKSGEGGRDEDLGSSVGYG